MMKMSSAPRTPGTGAARYHPGGDGELRRAIERSRIKPGRVEPGYRYVARARQFGGAGDGIVGRSQDAGRKVAQDRDIAVTPGAGVDARGGDTGGMIAAD